MNQRSLWQRFVGCPAVRSGHFLMISKINLKMKTQPPLGTKSVRPGQALDLGDIRIGPGFEENEFPPNPQR